MVQLGVGIDHVVAQPGTVLVYTQLAALADDAAEVGIDSHLVGIVVHQRPHGVADVNLCGENDEALQRAVPHGFIVVLG